MSVEWPEVKLSDHVNLLAGYAFRSAEYTDNEADIPLIRGANIGQGFLKWDDLKRWPPSKTEGIGKYFLEAGDVLLAMDRPWIDAGLKYAWAEEHILPCLLVQRVARMRGTESLDTGYLRYIIGSQKFSDYIQPIVTGVNVPHISATQIGDYSFPLPPLPTQRRIATVLSAYDDLIENNRQRIEALEAAAQALYREWFVEMRFPGWQDVEWLESELGVIPAGWEVKKFGEVTKNFDRKRIPLSKRQRAEIQGSYPYYGAAGILDYVNDFIFEGRYLLIAEDGNSIVDDNGFPLLQLIEGQFWVNNHTHVVQGIYPVATNYLYLFMSNTVVSGYVTGAAQPKINQTNLNRIPVLQPSKTVIDEFTAIVDDMFNMIIVLEEHNTMLKETRDLLLPRLISGEVSVEDLPLPEEVE